ncbi:MAG: hypothetical protein ACLP8S_00475 [Solirubrobacteraceae bacterium]
MDQAADPPPVAAELARVDGARGELLDPGSLTAIASELARRQAAQLRPTPASTAPSASPSAPTLAVKPWNDCSDTWTVTVASESR